MISELAVKINLIQKDIQLGTVGGGYLLRPADINSIGGGRKRQLTFQEFADCADRLFTVF